jgi:hypothetical protein
LQEGNKNKMATIEEKFWNEFVKKFLVSDPSASLPKAEQQALATALQEWAAHCIAAHLEGLLEEQERPDLKTHLQKEAWQVHHKGKDFLGAVRWQEVDVWLTNPEAGLVLAVDPKHFQSQDNLKKNWKNGHNDLVAFATNLHERFPLCAIGGVIAFPEWAAAPQSLQQMHSICGRSIPREKPLNSYGKFEGFALAVYNAKGNLTWPFKEDSPLAPNAAFTSIANAVYQRTIALL